MTFQIEETDSRNTEQAFAEIERQLEDQANETQKLRKNSAFFGGMVTLIALVSLIAVVTKLGTKDIRVTSATVVKAPAKAAAPAAATATPVAAGALPSASTVALKEFKVVPTATTLAAGKIIFKVHNIGNVTHEFVVLKTKFPAAHLPLYKGRADEAGNVGETGDLKAGASKSLSLILAPGHYALICNLPGHYLSGQHVDLTVK